MNQPLNIQTGRGVVIIGGGVTARWFKNLWNSSKGQTNPVLAFIEDTPLRIFAGNIDGIPIINSISFFNNYNQSQRPFIFIDPDYSPDSFIDIFQRLNIAPNRDAMLFPPAPDYTIDFLGPYPGWQEALGDSNGYEDSQNIEEHIEKASELKKKERNLFFSYPDQRLMAPFAFALKSLPNNLSVLDIGGALGAHYYWAKQYFPELQFSWLVSETEAMAKPGNDYFSNDELKFTDKFPEDGYKCDLAILSSVLQYLPDYKLYLNNLLKISPNYILIDRTPLSVEEADQVFVQRVYRSTQKTRFQTSYPLRVINQDNLFERLTTRYEICFQWPDEGDKYNLNGKVLTCSGVLFKKI